MNIVLKNARILSVFALTMFFFGCATEDEENLPQVTAGFTKTINEDTGTVTFINTSENATDYLWDFGNEQISTEINPVNSYENGTYIVTLTAGNVNGGGADVFSDTLTIRVKELITLPITFDDENVNYNATSFSGAEFEVVDNPDVSGSNSTASRVGEIINSGAAFEGLFFDLGSSIDLSDDSTIAMNFWSDVPVDVLMKLEEGTTSIEQTSDHDGTGWETIYFEFSSDIQFSKLTLFVDGPGNTAGSFYIDDIFQTVTLCRETDLLLPIDFDCQGTNYVSETFGGTTFDVIENSELSGINNTETNVGRIVNSGVSFEGITFTLDIPVDLSSAEAISIKLFSSIEIPVLLKLDGNSAIETSVNHSGTGWEKLTFDFTSTETFNQLSLLIDVSGTTAGTFYVDDIMLSQGSDKIAPVITLNGDPTLNLLIDTEFSDPGATATDNIDGDISDQIVVGGDNVDTNIEGTYVITYNVTDAAGNAASEVTRTVNVTATDTTAPVITLTGDAIINITVGDSFTDPGATATDNLDGDITENIVVTGSVDSNTAGTYTLNYNVSDASGNAATEVTRTVNVVPGTGGELIVNGDFESGSEPWYTNFGTNVPEIREDGGNNYFFADVTVANPSEPFVVNLSQKLTIIPGENYILTFTASSDRNRTIKAGIGETEDPFYTNSEVINLTNTEQTFEINLSARHDEDDENIGSLFGNSNSRVLFDLAAEVGVVVIDNVSLVQGGPGDGGGGPTEGNLITNPGFEDGQGDWLFFDNTGTVSIDNTESNGGTNSAKIFVEGPGGNPGLKKERFAVGTVQAGDVVQISFDHKGELQGEGGVFGVLLFVERADGEAGDPITVNFGALGKNPTLTTNWTTWTESYTIPDGSSVTGGLSLLIEGVCGPAGCGVNANIDNVSVVLNP